MSLRAAPVLPKASTSPSSLASLAVPFGDDALERSFITPQVSSPMAWSSHHRPEIRSIAPWSFDDLRTM